VAFLATALLVAGFAGPAAAQGPMPGGMGMPSVAGMPPGMPRMVAFDNAKRIAAAQDNVANGAVNNLQQYLDAAQPDPAPALEVSAKLRAGRYLSGAAALAAFPTQPGCLAPSTTVVDYSGTCVGNYANSPLPLSTSTPIVTLVGNPLTARTYASDDTAGLTGTAGTVLVVIPTPLPAGTLQDFQTYNQAAGNPLASGGNVFNAYLLRPTGVANQYSVVFDSGPHSVPVVTVDQIDTWSASGAPAVLAGDVIAFYGQGIPLDLAPAGTDVVSYPAPAAPVLNGVITVGDPATFPLLGQARTYSFAADIVTGANASVSGGIRKFVDTLPGVPGFTFFGANNLGQYIPLAVPDTTTYPGSDYYEIAVVQYREQMHSDLPPTLLRGYVQLSTTVVPGAQLPLSNAMLDGTTAPIAGYTGVDKPSYLGPVISAQRDRPVRILFRNLLPTGVAGDLFIPVDTTVMGSGMGPDGVSMYSENRATLHLHGGLTPWISDGTPDQWTTPAGEGTPYPKGVSVSNVPDMPDPGPGAMTFFYTNQQSARLMFYHDHAFGITRLNVYSGEAAGYLLSDPAEQALVGSVIPADQIPLVIQDKTFVPQTDQLLAQDPTWDTSKYGGFGNLWFPHVYMPNQNPNDPGLTGANAMGRWDYALWFFPPYNGLLGHGEVANPLCTLGAGGVGDPAGLSCTTMPVVPGTPNPSLVPEGFMDTPLVNGTAYPVLNIDPKAYRFRILNAANDRSWNLSLYQAGSNGPMWDANGNLLDANAGEVPMVPAVPNAAIPFPVDWTVASDGVPGTRPDILDGRASGVPNPANLGPGWIQLGTEGGVLPAVADIPPEPVGYQYNLRNIVVTNVTKHSLLLGPAERADVVVDFSQFAGKTLILYNDSGAPVPAWDPRNDYYTGDPDFTFMGGAPSTLPGYGPNTRTVMQIHVAAAPVAPAFNEAALIAAVPALFAATQDKPIVPEAAYGPAYGTTYANQYVHIQDTSKTFVNIDGTTLPNFPLKPKAIQELFELDYGRMNATLGVEVPFTNAGNQTTIPLGYSEPVTEVMQPSDLGTQVGSTNDGTQIWKITHNGVDTHAIHFHLFNVQLINRVGWDGAIRPPDANELGWKETVRMSPLEDAIVALRPVAPKLPFGVPDSFRLIDPTRPLGAPINTFDVSNGNPLTVPNALVNYHWEYVWHCHLLGHEENDMMRPIEFAVPSTPPAAPVLSFTYGSIVLAWTDGTPGGLPLGDPSSEVGYTIWRAQETNGTIGGYTKIAAPLANATTYTDIPPDPAQTYDYQVFAWNAAAPLDANGVGGVGSQVLRVLPPPQPTTTIVVSSSEPSIVGQNVTFTATVSPAAATGTVTFNVDGTDVLPAPTLSGGAATYSISTLTAGTHSIFATYGGDAAYLGSVSPTITQTVNKTATTTIVVSSLNPSVFGGSVSFTATVSPAAATGTVTFNVDGVAGVPVSLTAGQATFSTTSLAVGAHPVFASYSGDAAYLVSTSPTLTQTVGPVLRPTNTVVTSNRNPTANLGQNITFTATVTPQTGTGVPTGTIQFSIDGANVGGVLTLNAAGRATYSTATLSAGSHNVIATYSGSAVFAGGGSATFIQVVNQAASTTVVTSNRNPASVFGQSVTFTARVTPLAATGSVQFSIDGSPFGGSVVLDATGRATLVISTLPVGSHTISAAYSGNTNYLASTGSLTRPVNKANSRTVVTTSGTPARPGATVTFTATVGAVAPGVGIPTGTVQFVIDGVNAGGPLALNSSGQAAFSISTLALGLHRVSAVYVGDAGFNASTSANINQRIR
jgi:FtsP/CotA-like multicopper oxidase with cupredoxin domain